MQPDDNWKPIGGVAGAIVERLRKQMQEREEKQKREQQREAAE